METATADIRYSGASLFKSYYEVWKHVTGQEYYNVADGLNRTM